MRKSASKNYIETTIWNQEDVEGAVLEGRYVTSDTFLNKQGKQTIKYIIEGKDGVMYGIFGTVALNRLFQNIPEGAYVWVTYKGKQPTKNGFQVKLFEVEYDDEI